MSGIVGDARILVDQAPVEAQNHRFNYTEPMTIEQITEGTSMLSSNLSLAKSNNIKYMNTFAFLETPFSIEVADNDL